MVAASQVGDGFTCEQGDIATVDLGRTYDAVIALFHVLSYQITNQQLQSVFANAARHLNTGGLFLFDFWYSPAVYSQRPSVRIKRVSNQNISLTRIAEPLLLPSESRVDVHYTFFVQQRSSAVITSFNEVHSMRHFSLRELDFYAKDSGFERITAEEPISGRAPISCLCMYLLMYPLRIYTFDLNF
jgi:SAM-dependent methyltransferase